MSISFVTCIQNQRKIYFEECALSVAKQRGDNQWIIIDDGSAQIYRNTYKNILRDIFPSGNVEFIELETSVGLSAARNLGINVAQGKWVVVLDSDDRLGNNLSAAFNALSDVVHLVAFNTIYFDENTVEHRSLKRYKLLQEMYGGTVLDPLLWYDYYYHGIIARLDLLKAIGGYNPNLRLGEDQDILLRATELINREQFYFIDAVGYEYRNNASGVCSTRWREVAANYLLTMLAASNRRGSKFIECRFDGPQKIDGVQVDCYSYNDQHNHWMNWDIYQSNHSN